MNHAPVPHNWDDRRAPAPFQRHSGQGKRAGFTLVELMVVMAIVGLVVTTVSLSMEAILPGERLNTTIRELAADLQQVRTEAVSRSMEFRLEYDLDGERYRIATPYRIGGGRIVTTDDPSDEELRFYTPWTPMRDGVELMSVYTGGEMRDEGRVIVRFDALGSATDHAVIVTQPAYGNSFTLEVLGLTGLIRMHDGVVIREPATDGDFD